MCCNCAVNVLCVMFVSILFHDTIKEGTEEGLKMVRDINTEQEADVVYIFQLIDPGAAPKVVTQNLFSIFTQNSKFTNSPGPKARKYKPRKQKSFSNKSEIGNTLLKYFKKGKEDEA